MDASKSAILKQFDLPERKSKIETIYKMRVTAPTLYCLCQSTDIDRFMICCEKCDEWYHGDCVGVEEEEAKRIKRWYCPECVGNYGLKIIYRKKKYSRQNHSEKHKKKRKGSPKPIPFRCGKCSNCLQNEECGNRDQSLAHKMWPSKRAKYEASETCAHPRIEEKENRPKTVMMSERQCCGPRCTRAARPNSKYCSDQCGLSLAQCRILEIIPQRLAEQALNPSVAEKIDEKKLRRIREKKEEVIGRLKQHDAKEKRLLSLIARGKSVPVMETTIEEPTDEEHKMYCVTCGWDIPVKSAIKHMELCFRKYEAQSVLVSKHKSLPDYNMLCEHFDPSAKTYCKRLRYICPDHFKPMQPKENEGMVPIATAQRPKEPPPHHDVADEVEKWHPQGAYQTTFLPTLYLKRVCGCPMIKTISKSIFYGAEKYCQQPKKKCDQHYHWDILAQADLDLDRLREWNKFAALVEEEAVLVKQMIGRCGALGLLLHSTSAA